MSMERIVTKAGRSKVKIIPPLNQFDLMVSKKLNFIGISLINDIFIQIHHPIYSYRIKPENFIQIEDIKFLKCKGNIDKLFLNQYFTENNDNPFSLQLILTLMEKGEDVNQSTVLTQFPPLLFSKDIKETKIKFDYLISQAIFGDIIFMFDRKSRVSQVIREIDFSPWSHVANIYENKLVFDMTTRGIVKYHLSELDPLENDFALYRHYEELSQDKKIWMKKHMDNQITLGIKYNWAAIPRIYLWRKFRFFRFLRKNHRWKDKTLSDIIYSNNFKLIAFA